MLDGVGVQEGFIAQSNPAAGLELPTLQKLGITLCKNHTETDFFVQPLDANLGIDGLPQSGTGQTTILTGINASAKLGFHYGPWVSPSLRPLLEDNILKKIKSVRLANNYPEQYLAALTSKKTRLNAIASAALSAGAELEGHQGIGIAPMLHLPNQAPDNLQIRRWAQDFMASKSKVTIFDQWWTDHLGHSMDTLAAKAFLERLEQFCAACLEFRAPDALFLVTSDHGNFEDLTTKSHTRNPVPLAVVGNGAEHFMNAKSLTDIAPALEKLFFGSANK